MNFWFIWLRAFLGVIDAWRCKLFVISCPRFAWQQAALHLTCGERSLGTLERRRAGCFKRQQGENFPVCLWVCVFSAWMRGAAVLQPGLHWARWAHAVVDGAVFCLKLVFVRRPRGVSRSISKKLLNSSLLGSFHFLFQYEIWWTQR